MKRSAEPAGGPPSGDTDSFAGHRWTRSLPSTTARHSPVCGCCDCTGASTGGHGSGTPNRSRSTRSCTTTNGKALGQPLSSLPHRPAPRNEPVIVPPVLAKSSLLAQPVLRLVWTLAFEVLTWAKRVTFIGYSFPSTDLASRPCFLKPCGICRARTYAWSTWPPKRLDIEPFKTGYRGVLGEIPDHRFSFHGAVPWIRTLADQAADAQARTPSNPAI